MSVDFDVSLVEWPSFVKAVCANPLLELPDFWDEFPPEPEANGGSWGVAGELWERFDEMRRTWSSPGSEAFAELFGTIFWSFRSGRERVDDLGLSIDNPFGIDSAWNPQTVARFSDVWRRINFEEGRWSFPNVSSDAPYSTFDEFQAGAQEWGKLILRAASESRGFVVHIIG